MIAMQNTPYHEYESSISPKGQITLPSQTRKQLGLRTKDKVRIRVFENGSMVIQPAKDDIESFYRLIPAMEKSLTIEEMREIAYTQLYKERSDL